MIASHEKVWVEGFMPGFSREQLTALLKGLEADDPKLIQGATTTPPPLMCVQDWPVEAACAIGYAYWQGSNTSATVGETTEFFARMCHEADQRLGELAACRWFLNWFDDTPRDQMRAELSTLIKEHLDAIER